MFGVRRSKLHGGRYDWALVSVVTILLALGVLMVFSASYPRGLEGYGDPYHFVSLQLAWLVVGLAALVITARIPYEFWQRWSILIMGAALLSLLAVIVIGAERFGATRTFYQGSMQPSEPAKLAIMIYVAAWLSSKGRRIRNVRAGLLPFGVLMGVVAVLIVLQPEITAAILIVATAGIMLFIAGADIKQLAVVGVITAATFFVVIRFSSYAGDRVERYLASVGNPLASEEWQVRQAVQALMRGGLFGQGVGNGLAQQTGFLPLSWSDNIFGVIGEELGLLGTLFVILLFALLAYRGLRIALRTPDNFGMLLALGITTMFILQALLNMAVIVATSPPTGVTLPFISYGGSSLVAALAGVGILLSISRYGARVARPADAGKYSYERVDLGRRDRGTRVSGTGRAPAARSGSYQSTAPRPPSAGDGRVRGSSDGGARRRQD
jgi:cell division protein FtsW